MGVTKVTFLKPLLKILKQGNTYSYTNLKVYQDKFSSNEIALATISKTKNEVTEAFQEALPVTELSQDITTDLASYMSCIGCDKNIQGNQPIIECPNCHIKQKRSRCQQHWYAQVLFLSSSNNKDINCTMFEDTLKQAVAVAGHQADQWNQVALESILLDMPEFSMTYNMQSKVISSVAPRQG